MRSPLPVRAAAGRGIAYPVDHGGNLRSGYCNYKDTNKFRLYGRAAAKRPGNRDQNTGSDESGDQVAKPSAKSDA